MLKIFTLVFQSLLLGVIISFSNQTKISKTKKYTSHSFNGYTNDFDIDVFIKKLINN